MHISYNQFYSTVFCLLYVFRTNLVVHHQQHGIIYCITQFGTIVQASLAASRQPRLHDCTECTKLCNTVYYAVLLQASLAASSNTRLHDCTDCTKLCNTVYYAVLLQASLPASSQTRLHDCTDCTKLCNTAYNAVLLLMNDQTRSKHVEQTKNRLIKKLVTRISHVFGY